MRIRQKKPLSKMKKAAAILLGLMIALLSACSAGDTVVLSPLNPEKTMTEPSDNSLGARFTFTLDEYTELLNRVLVATNPDNEDARLSADQWNTLSDRMVDDNGIAYSSYFYVSSTVTYTAAQENESEKLFNIGIGCPKEILDDSESEYHDSVIVMASLMVVTAGGYNLKELDSIYGLFSRLMQGEEDITIPGLRLSMDIYEDTAIFLLSADVGETPQSTIAQEM